MQTNENGFQVYKHKSRGRKSGSGSFGGRDTCSFLNRCPSTYWNDLLQQHRQSTNTLHLETLNIKSTQVLQEQIFKCSNELSEDGGYSKNLIESLKQSDCSVNNIVCYGLGGFTRSIISLYQLCQVLLIRSAYTLQEPVKIFDPCFNQFEIDWIQTSKQLQLITENTECRYQVKTTSCTLFFMPHMTIEFYNNLLDSNVDQLDKLIILGNSLNLFKRPLSIQCDQKVSSKQKLYSYSDYAHKIGFKMHQILVPNIFPLEDVFNDMAVSYFTKIC